MHGAAQGAVFACREHLVRAAVVGPEEEQPVPQRFYLLAHLMGVGPFESCMAVSCNLLAEIARAFS